MRHLITRADLTMDKPEILALWERNLPDALEARYSWIYRNNPCGQATCWLARDSSTGALVGSTALFPRRIFVKGKPMVAGIAGDYAVDKECRVFGPAIALQKNAVSECDEKRFDLIYGLPNHQSEAVHLRVGYKIIGEVFTLTKPLRSKYRLKRYIDIPFVTKIMAKLVDNVLKCVSKETYYKASGKYIIDQQKTFDKRFDILWEQIKYQFTVVGDRSSAYLNWRYIECPHRTYSIFSISDSECADIVGYIVFHVVKKRTYIDDLVSLGTGETLESLLSEFIRFQRKEGTESLCINYMGTQLLLRKLQEYGFAIRGKEGKVLVYVSQNSSNSFLTTEEENWYLLAGDNDI